MHGVSLLLLLLAAGYLGWYLAKRGTKTAVFSPKKKAPRRLPKDYIKGLNFLFNEEPDKAVDLFIKMLEVDSDTVETHLTLGALFRRRGQVDRAIRIHQNLIARPKLETAYRLEALLALAQDYQSAGVLDRAEKLFLELIDLGQHLNISLKSLLSIYEQEKEWGKAIDTAKLLMNKSKVDMSVRIAQYHCELAEIALHKKAFDTAERQCRLALQHNLQCARAQLTLANIYFTQGALDGALKALEIIKHVNNEEAFKLRATIYTQKQDQAALTRAIQDMLEHHPKMHAALEAFSQDKDIDTESKIKTLRELLRETPSLSGLNELIGLQLQTAKAEVKEDLMILHGLAQRLQAEQPDYQCSECGFYSKQAYWQCPSCKNWETLSPAGSNNDKKTQQ